MSSREESRPPEPLVVFTDLDGCLLDERTYDYGPAAEALQALRREGIPLIFCSSKTRAEVEFLAEELRFRSPFIVENGGAIVLPEGYSAGEAPEAIFEERTRVLPLGLERRLLVQTLPLLGAEAGVRLRGFSSLEAGEVARLTGLSLSAAERALRRQYDEPFLLAPDEAHGYDAVPEDERVAAVARAAERRGLRVTRGGRFYHLTGPTDKGRAVRQLLSILQAGPGRLASVGLGDSANDLPMLQAVERPIVVPRPGGLDTVLAASLPRAERAPAPGPAGWNAAVLAVLGGSTLPRVGDGRR